MPYYYDMRKLPESILNKIDSTENNLIENKNSLVQQSNLISIKEILEKMLSETVFLLEYKSDLESYLAPVIKIPDEEEELVGQKSKDQIKADIITARNTQNPITIQSKIKNREFKYVNHLTKDILRGKLRNLTSDKGRLTTTSKQLFTRVGLENIEAAFFYNSGILNMPYENKLKIYKEFWNLLIDNLDIFTRKSSYVFKSSHVRDQYVAYNTIFLEAIATLTSYLITQKVSNWQELILKIMKDKEFLSRDNPLWVEKGIVRDNKFQPYKTTHNKICEILFLRTGRTYKNTEIANRLEFIKTLETLNYCIIQRQGKIIIKKDRDEHNVLATINILNNEITYFIKKDSTELKQYENILFNSKENDMHLISYISEELLFPAQINILTFCKGEA